MRIAHVLRRLSFDDWGGTEQVVWNLAKAQKAAGHDVRLFATTALWGGNLATKDTKVTKKSLCSMCSLWQKNKPYKETVDGTVVEEIVKFGRVLTDIERNAADAPPEQKVEPPSPTPDPQKEVPSPEDPPTPTAIA